MTSQTSQMNIYETPKVSNTHTPANLSKLPVFSNEDIKARNEAFQGRPVSVLIKQDDFPKLGSVSRKEKKRKEKKRKQPGKNSFFAGTSYREERQHNNRQHNNRPQFNSQYNADRTKAFAMLEDKESLAKKLTCTRVCRNVNFVEGEWTVCTRQLCSFAHSQKEFNPPPCQFGTTCNRKHGSDNRPPCRHKHDDEDVQGWLKRSGQKMPALPPTSEKTRDPSLSENIPFKPRDLRTPRKKIDLSSPSTSTTSPSKKNHIPILETILETPPKSDKILSIPSAPVKTVPVKAWKNIKPLSSDSDSDCDIDSDASTKCIRSRSRVRRTLSNIYSRRKSRSRSPTSKHIIQVPTEELAKMAIQAAFDRGVYNIKVLVE